MKQQLINYFPIPTNQIQITIMISYMEETETQKEVK